MYDFRETRPTRTRNNRRARLAGINYRHVELDQEKQHGAFRSRRVCVSILGGIGKGHAVDRGIAVLQARGISTRSLPPVAIAESSAIVSVKPWVVGIRHPDRKREVIARIPLEDAALSTSGDYERYFDENGVRYHHIIDPKTGHSASKVRSATIIGPTATRTDGLSKTRVRARPGEGHRDLQPARGYRCGAGDAGRQSAVHEGD